MRTEVPEREPASLSRRSFVVASGGAAGTVFGSGLASADADGAVVAATDPYLEAASEAASVRVSPARDVDEAADVLVSGRPDSEAHDATTAVVDGVAALETASATWRDVLAPAEVRDRLAGDAPVEAWSESTWEGVSSASLDPVERSADDPATLVRGTRAYQYATGHGGVGYYDVDPESVSGTPVGEGSDATPLVRLGYVHADGEARTDARVSAFLDDYGASATDVVAPTHLDPAVEE